MSAWLGKSMFEDIAGGTEVTLKSIGDDDPIKELACPNGLNQQRINLLSLKPTKPQIDTH